MASASKATAAASSGRRGDILGSVARRVGDPGIMPPATLSRANFAPRLRAATCAVPPFRVGAAPSKDADFTVHSPRLSTAIAWPMGPS